MEKLFKDKLICLECKKVFEQRIPTIVSIKNQINYCSECCKKKGLCEVCQKKCGLLH